MPNRSKFALQAEFRAKDKVSGVMDRLKSRTGAFSRSASRSFGAVNKNLLNMRTLLKGAAALLAGGLIAKGFKSIISEASQVETITTEFETLTGSLEKATKLVEEMRIFGAKTPLQFTDISEGTKRLLAFGIAQEDVLEVMRRLGDTALGDANKLDSLTRAYGKVSARGKASMEEINMVIDAGVPIMDALNQQMGTTTEELSKLIRNGEITSEVFQQAFRTMTDEGGQFFGGMEKKSQTLAGLWSTLKDNLSLAAGSLGSLLIPVLKRAIRWVSGLVERIQGWIEGNRELLKQKVDNFFTKLKTIFKQLQPVFEIFWNILKGVFNIFVKLSPILPGIVGAFVAYKLAMKGIAAINIVKQIFSMVSALGAQTAATGAATTAQYGLNTAMSANPIGLIIMAIAALVAAVIGLVRHWDEAMDMMKFQWRTFTDTIFKEFNPVISFFQEVFELFRKLGELMRTKMPVGERLQAMRDVFKNFDAGERASMNAAARGADVSRQRGIRDYSDVVNRNIRDLDKAGIDITNANITSTADLFGLGQGLAERGAVQTQNGQVTVDVNINGLPQGATVKQTGTIPGMNLNTGIGSGILQ